MKLSASILFFALLFFGENVIAQLAGKVDENLFSHAQRELESVHQQLDAAIAKIDYVDSVTDQDRPWLESISAWEKLEYKADALPSEISEIRSIAPDKRTPQQSALLTRYYLGFVNAEHRQHIGPLVERQLWLEACYRRIPPSDLRPSIGELG